jgi:predicted dienelactone hydrolase
MNVLSCWKPRALVWLCLLLTPGLALADPAEPGPFASGWRSVTVVRPNSSTFPAQLFYPATGAGGANAPLDASGGPYPVISFGHGFLQPVDRYQSTLRHLATWGFLVIASESELGLFPSHSAFAADLSHCLTWLEAQSALPASFLFGTVAAGQYGLSGHSMGGGCSILAAANDPRVKAVANLAAANTNPSAVAQMVNVRVPVSLIAGSSDSITPVANHGQLMYNAGEAPRLLPLIIGGSHCGFQDFSTFGCDSGPLARTEQLRLTRQMLTTFFLLYLKDDQSTWRQVWGPEGLNQTGVTVQAQPGVALDVLGTLEAFGGQWGEVTVRVLNQGAEPAAYGLAVDGGSWEWQAVPYQTSILPPGGSTNVLLRVRPQYAFSPAADQSLISARSLVDGGTRTFAAVSASRLCRADLDRSGALNIEDFIAMLNLYALQSPDADINADGLLNIEDFTTFLNAYALGCD